jgi:hypothetical protein
MATFEHRKAELRTLFESQKTLMKPWEWEPISRALESYFPVRDAALSSLVDVVTDDGSEAQRGRYESTLDSGAASIGSALGNLLGGLKDAPSEGARLFREQVIVQEGLFFRSLDAPDPCMTRDLLVNLEAGLIKMIADLDAKWSRLKDSGKSIVDKELAATQAMESLLSDAIRTSAPLHERVGAAIAQLLDAASRLGDDVNTAIVQWCKEYAERNPGLMINADSAKDATEISKIGAALFARAKELGIPAAVVARALPFLIRDPGMVVSDNLLAVLPKTLLMVLLVLGEMRKGLVYVCLVPYASRVGEVRDSLPFQGVIIASLSETRADVGTFMEKNGLDVARKLKEQSAAAFEAWVNAQPRDCNHDDAVDLRIAMEAPLQKRFDRLLSRLEDFVGDWGGIFLGSLSTEARRVLLNQEEWDRQMSDLAGLGLDQRLQVWKDTTLSIDPRLGDAWTQIQGAFAGLPVDLQYGMMQRVRAVWDPIISDIRSNASSAGSELDQAQRVAGSEQQRRDLDRSAALAKLPA